MVAFQTLKIVVKYINFGEAVYSTVSGGQNLNGGEWWLRLTTSLTSVSRTLHAVVQVDHM